jgi:methionine--tRNA ligase beta chain
MTIENTQKPIITFDNVMSIQIETCQIISCQRVEKTKNLLQMIVIDKNNKQYSAITNIGSQFEPEQLLNKIYPFVLNMEPAIIRGIKSEAMIVAFNNSNKEIKLIEQETIGLSMF